MNPIPISNPRVFLLASCMWAVSAVHAVAGEEANTSVFWKDQVVPFLRAYCADCHSGSQAEAGIDFEPYLSLEELTGQAMMADRSRWNQIRGMIKIGAMPPADYEPRPSVDQRQSIAAWIHQQANTVDCQTASRPGRVTMRRLNNAEYDYSIRDLLAIDFSPSAAIGFPADEVGSSFDNQGDVLSLSDLQLEKYLQAAALVASKALEPPESLSKQTAELPSLYLGDSQSVTFLVAEGEYEIKPRLQFSQQSEQPAVVVLSIDDQPVERLEVTGKRKSYRINLSMTAGRHRVALKFEQDPGETVKRKDRRIDIESVSLAGPPVETESYAKLTEAKPSETLSPVEAARQNLTPIIRLAYRREPTPEDVERVLSVVRMSLELGESFEKSLGMGLRAILVSPHFLFRVEEEDGSSEIQQYALASRLSYFLWSSIPDSTLLELARDGRLSQPDVLEAQVRRMLSDARSEALIKHFFGQYLGLGNLRDVSPDPEQFPEWNDRLRDAMQRETELFCREIVREDLPVDTLLRGDFTFVNPRLAEYYAIEFDGQDPSDLFERGPGFHDGRRKGRNKDYLDEHRWVKVPAPNRRRGVLTHGSILTLTSNPTATSPVKRGKWIMETILGDPPPPAPPNVPAFEETQSEHKNITLREQLAIHRANPSCASCHDVMDPLGLGFENFDAIGRWRDTDSGLAVDASGKLADGQTFSGALELLDRLSEKQSQIYRYFAEKLLMYSLGRELEPYDQCAVDTIMQVSAESGFRLSSFVLAVTQSEPFTKRSVVP